MTNSDFHRSAESDVAKRLLDRVKTHDRMTCGSDQALGYYSSWDAQLMREAADEIERLRHDLDRHMQIAVDVLNDAQSVGMSREKLAHTIAKQIACEEDCQKWPNGCGCALNAADAILASQPSPAATVDDGSMHGEYTPVTVRASTAPHNGSSADKESVLLEIIGHLGAILVQAIPSDDQIIIDHVRQAHDLARELRRMP